MPDARGLTSAEVAGRIARGQVNRTRRSDFAEYRDIVSRNFLTLFNALVVPAAILLFLLDEEQGAVAVSGMALTNLVLGLVQEIRAKRHLDKLALLAEARVRVLRDGRVLEVPSGDVVLDDHLLLAAGEPVVADGTVLEAHYLEVDEALLTGESDPVARHAGESLLSGSYCVAGEGAYRADRVGGESFAQRTSAEARAYRHVPSPLQQKIDRLIRWLTSTAVTLCALYGVLYLVGNVSDVEAVKMVAATITSMVPQGLVLMATLAFTLGAVRLSRRGALVQRLPAVEAMASVDTVCMDKTGTLTTNRLELARIVPLGGQDEGEARRLLALFASLSVDRDSKSLVALREGLGEVKGELLDQLPFKSQNRYSAVRVRGDGEQREHVLVLGACEALRPYLGGDANWEAAWRELLPTGLRLMLFAEANEAPPAFSGTLAGLTLRPTALVGLRDEVRPEAGEVLGELAGQGIRFKVLSGDHAETVRATAQSLQVLAGAEVVSGAELESAAEPERLMAEGAIFGRVSPEQKVQLVTALQGQGHRVAMIGDGINDVLPIKHADLGVAMGSGSRATKVVADLVLENNDFALLPATLGEGRTIVGNVRRAAKLFLTKNAYTLLLIVGAIGLFHLPFPYEPQQVTLLNFLTIGVPGLLIMLDRRHRSDAPREGFLVEVVGFAVRSGAVIAVAGLGVMLWGGHLAAGEIDPQQGQRTLLLTVLVLVGWVTLWRVVGEKKYLIWVAVGVPVYLTALYWGPVRSFFALVPLSLVGWGISLGLAGAAWVGMAMLDRGYYSLLAWREGRGTTDHTDGHG